MNTEIKTAEEILRPYQNYLSYQEVPDYLRKVVTVEDCLKAMKEYASQSVATPEAEIEKRILAAYYAGFNQSHYSHVHPERFPAKTCEYGGAEYWNENKKYILAAIKKDEPDLVASDNTLSSDKGDAPFKANATIKQDYKVVHKFLTDFYTFISNGEVPHENEIETFIKEYNENLQIDFEKLFGNSRLFKKPTMVDSLPNNVQNVQASVASKADSSNKADNQINHQQ